eukprot:1390778-Amorphochlora_amoeboformis.AAC.1
MLSDTLITAMEAGGSERGDHSIGGGGVKKKDKGGRKKKRGGISEYEFLHNCGIRPQRYTALCHACCSGVP